MLFWKINKLKQLINVCVCVCLRGFSKILFLDAVNYLPFLGFSKFQVAIKAGRVKVRTEAERGDESCRSSKVC